MSGCVINYNWFDDDGKFKSYGSEECSIEGWFIRESFGKTSSKRVRGLKGKLAWTHEVGWDEDTLFFGRLKDLKRLEYIETCSLTGVKFIKLKTPEEWTVANLLNTAFQDNKNDVDEWIKTRFGFSVKRVFETFTTYQYPFYFENPAQAVEFKLRFG